MERTDFVNFLNTHLAGKALEQQAEILHNINEWTVEYTNNFKNNYTCCRYCKKYSLRKDFAEISKEDIRKFQLLHSAFEDKYDNPFDDNVECKDIYGDVSYIVKYRICPICKYEEKLRENVNKVLKTYTFYRN